MVGWIDDERLLDLTFFRRSEDVFRIGAICPDQIDEHVEAEKHRYAPRGVFEQLEIIHSQWSHFLPKRSDMTSCVLSFRKSKEEYEVADDDERCDDEFHED